MREKCWKCTRDAGWNVLDRDVENVTFILTNVRIRQGRSTLVGENG